MTLPNNTFSAKRRVFQDENREMLGKWSVSVKETFRELTQQAWPSRGAEDLRSVARTAVRGFVCAKGEAEQAKLLADLAFVCKGTRSLEQSASALGHRAANSECQRWAKWKGAWMEARPACRGHAEAARAACSRVCAEPGMMAVGALGRCSVAGSGHDSVWKVCCCSMTRLRCHRQSQARPLRLQR